MGTPAKKRKLNSDSKSPGPARNLDYFFGKQRQNLPIQNPSGGEQRSEDAAESTALTDEEFARKLQAEWDQEEAEARGNRQASQASPAEVEESSEVLVEELIPSGTNPEDLNGESPSQAAVTLPEPKTFSLFGAKARNTLSLQSNGPAEDTITSNIPFDESPLTFEPSKYMADLQGYWTAEGGDASYALLTRCFVLVNSTQSRIKIVDTLVNLLRVLIEGDPSSLLPTVRQNILSNRLLLSCALFL